MNFFISIRKRFLLTRAIILSVTFSFMVSMVAPSLVYAQSTLNLPVPGTMVVMTPSYTPTVIQGITIDPENPLKFDFLINSGDADLPADALKEESLKLIKYFLASLTVAEEQMWVNLSPYEADRIIPEDFGRTEMGRDLLAQDYLLKQLTSSLMHPDENLGKEFWNRVYAKAQKLYGTTDIPMNTFNKIWIVPQTAEVYVHGQTVFVVDSHLKVMIEEDYLALEHHTAETSSDDGVSTGVTNEIVREVLIPEIEYEINKGTTFANLRQIFNSVILATWYKDNLKSSFLGQVYIDQGKTSGIESTDQGANQKIYEQYVQAFETGVYDFVREERVALTDEIIPRKYFSGGVDAAMTVATVEASAVSLDKNLVRVGVELEKDFAMASDDTDNADPNLVLKAQAFTEVTNTGNMVSNPENTPGFDPSRRKVLTFIGAACLAGCGDSGGGSTTPGPTPEPPKTLDSKIRDLRNISWTAAKASPAPAQLTAFISHITSTSNAGENGVAFILNEGYLTDSSPNVRLGAVRALAQLQSQLTSSAISALEARLTGETDPFILGEIQDLMLSIYEDAVASESDFETAINLPAFTNLFNLLKVIQEDRIVDDGWLENTKPAAVQFAGVTAYLEIVLFPEVYANPEIALNKFIDLITAQGEGFIENQNYLTSATDSFRLGAIRSLNIIHIQSGALANNLVSDLEGLLTDSQGSIASEAQTLLIDVYENILTSLSFDTAKTASEFGKLMNILINEGEDFVVAGPWLTSTDDILRFVGVSALAALNVNNGGLSAQTIVALNAMLPESNTEIRDAILAILNNSFTDAFLEGIQERWNTNVGLAIENNRASAFDSGYAAIAAMYLTQGNDLTIAQSFLEKFRTDFETSTPFLGFTMHYDASGNRMNDPQGRPPAPSTMAAVTVAFTALHYTALSGDQTYLPLIFGIVDWLENSAYSSDPNMRLVAQGMENFNVNARQSAGILGSQNLITRGFLDELDAFLEANDAIESTYNRQASVQFFADDLHTGILANLVDSNTNRYIHGGTQNIAGDVFRPTTYQQTGLPLLESLNPSLAILQSNQRPLPGGLTPSQFMTDANATFNLTVVEGGDIEGFTLFEKGSPIGASIVHIDRTAAAALANGFLGNDTEKESYIDALVSQAVDITAQGAQLEPQATRAYTNGLGIYYSDQDDPKVQPTGAVALSALDLNAFAIPTAQQVAALQSAQSKAVQVAAATTQSTPIILAQAGDQAQITEEIEEGYGGIDLNPNNYDIQSSGSSVEMIIPNAGISPDNFRFDGFTPVIIQLAPVTNLPLLLGIADQQEDPLQAAQIDSVGELSFVDRKTRLIEL